MHIGTYVAEKHIGEEGVLAIEIHEYVESRSGELIFSIDSEGTIQVSDKVRQVVAAQAVTGQD